MSLKKKDTDPGGGRNLLTVHTRNELVDARFRLTEGELNLLFYILHIVRDGERTYRFEVHDMMKISGQNQIRRSDIMRWSRNLGGCPVTTSIGEDHFDMVFLFSRISYMCGRVEVVINPEAMPLFEKTRNKFTLMRLKAALSLNSKYSKRLYWILCQWKSRGSVTYSESQFRELLNLDVDINGHTCTPEHYIYRDISILNQRIRSWVREINEKTDISVGLDYVKRGRRYEAFVFSIRCNDQVATEIKDEDGWNEFLQRCFYYRLTEAQAISAWEKGFRLDSLENLIKRILESTDVRQIRNSGAYVASCIDSSISPDVTLCVNEKDSVSGKKEAIELIKEFVGLGIPLSRFKKKMMQYGITSLDFDDVSN